MDSDDRWSGGEPGAGRERAPGGIMAPVVVAAIIVAGLYFARPVLEPFALAVLLSLMLAPAVRWLHRHGVGRLAAVALSVFLAFVVILGFAAAVGDEAISLAKRLPEYEQNIATKIRSLGGAVPGSGVIGRASRVFRELGDEFATSVTPAQGGAAQGPVPVVIRNPQSPTFELLNDVVGPLLPVFASAGLVVL
ncbi:MAG TPA: AI-2E family transporter, partial [Stellaceae bacterium]|nr:AI-2E family transporter [Stellaceae bacterium]